MKSSKQIQLASDTESLGRSIDSLKLILAQAWEQNLATEIKSCMNLTIRTVRVIKVVISKSIINHWFTQKYITEKCS